MREKMHFSHGEVVCEKCIFSKSLKAIQEARTTFVIKSLLCLIGDTPVGSRQIANMENAKIRNITIDSSDAIESMVNSTKVSKRWFD